MAGWVAFLLLIVGIVWYVRRHWSSAEYLEKVKRLEEARQSRLERTGVQVQWGAALETKENPVQGISLPVVELPSASREQQEHVWALGRQATQLKTEKRWDEAVECLMQQRALAAELNVVMGTANLLRLPLYLQQAGQFEDAQAEFERLLASAESEVDGWLSPNVSPASRALAIARERQLIADKARLASKRQKRPDLMETYQALSDTEARTIEALQPVVECERAALVAASEAEQARVLSSYRKPKGKDSGMAKNFDLMTAFVERTLGRPIGATRPVKLSGADTAAALWELNDLFRTNLAQLRTLAYDPAFEAETDVVIEAVVMRYPGATWSALSAGAWRVLLERHQQALVVALANEAAGNPVMSIPEGFPESARTGAAVLFLLHGMTLPFPAADRSGFEVPEGALPATLSRH